MSLPTITITGRVALPDNSAVGATLVFLLSGPDADSETDVVAPREVEVELDSEGAFTGSLWPTARGTKARTYQARLHLPAGPVTKVARTEGLGSFSLNEAAAARSLSELLRGDADEDTLVTSRAGWAQILAEASDIWSSAQVGISNSDNGEYFVVAAGGGVDVYENDNGTARRVVFIAEVTA